MHKLSKTTLFFLALIAGSTTLTTVFGQSRFSIAPTVSAGYRYMNFNYQPAGSGVASQLTGSGSYHTVAIGLMSYYAFSKHGSVSVGVTFNRFTGIEQFTHGNSNVPVEELESGSNNLQLPILVNYTTSSHRLSPYLSVGTVLGYTNADPVAYYNINKQTSLADILVQPDMPPKAVRIQALLGAGAQYQFAPTVALIVQPTATYEFGRPSAGYAQYHVYTLGLQTQLKCTF